MTSSCTLLVDEVELTFQKAYVPDFLSGLFQESDRVETQDGENDEAIIVYRASRESILKRLDLMGCTAELAEARFRGWRDEEIEKEESYLEEWGADLRPRVEETLRDLRALTWKEWRRRIPEVLRTLYDFDNHADGIDRRIKEQNETSWLWFDGFDSLFSLRAIIDAAPDTKTITLDVGDLIHAGWIGADEKVCGGKARIVAKRGQPAGPTIILAEGKSDIALLKASLARFHPDVVEFVTFLDHSDFKVDGGASYVVKFLKAFAAARVPASIVAVFDNDAAGLAAYKEAKALNLPSNMACVHLPDIEVGRSYPTIGPQGMHHAGINGRACGIELYLGRTALSRKETLSPVRWTGYDARADTYQGEVEDKDAVQEAFVKEMRGAAVDVSGENYGEMRLLWQTILQAAARTAEESQKAARVPIEW